MDEVETYFHPYTIKTLLLNKLINTLRGLPLTIEEWLSLVKHFDIGREVNAIIQHNDWQI